MFKKNKNGDEAKTKIFKDRKSKKEKKSKDDIGIFTFCEVGFKDFRTYCANSTEDGDWILNLGSADAIMCTYNTESTESDEKYDENLVQVYRHQDSSLVTKNTKMLGDSNPYSSIVSLCYFVERKFWKHKEVEKLASKISEFFDRRMTDGDSVRHIHIWVPVQKTTSKDCLLIKLLDGRINLVIT